MKNITFSNSFLQGGTCCWMSPELFNPRKFNLQDSCLTRCSDCYALRMVIYEVLSGKAPFSQYHDYHVVAIVLKGKCPGMPQGVEGMCFTGDIWRILEWCWSPIPGDHPGIQDVLQCLEMVSRTWMPPSPQMLVGLLTTDLSTYNPDSSGGESTDGSEVSPSSQVGPSQSLQKLPPTGDPN